jgi:aminoglycoside phosphotransferase (APT) family kinase protein
MPAISVCPEKQAWQELVSGQLPAEEVERLAQHLEQCQRCLETVQSLHAADTFSELLKANPSTIDSGAGVEGLMQRLKALAPTEEPAASAPPPPAALPEKIGRYRVLERIGVGGMGTVYKAHDPELDRVVALKLPRFDASEPQSADRKARFLREARAAAKVRHANVCPIYDVGEQDGQAFVVMAFVEGESLAQWLNRNSDGVPVTDAIPLVQQILAALDAVHARGIVHRDLKPGNILLQIADCRMRSPRTEGVPVLQSAICNLQLPS